jgi:mannose-6-phosphate isomerase-like protein (cupin superfamily)
MRALLVAGGRVSLAVVAVAAAVVLAGAVVLIPSPVVVGAGTSVEVTPDRSDQVLVCAGGALGLTRGDNPQVAAVAEPRLRSSGEGLIESSVTTSDALGGGATAVTLPQEAPGDAVAATQIVRAGTSDVSGLAASECLPAARSAWLVGGSTTVGRTTFIVITNADAVNATVELRVWGDAGPIVAPGLSGIIVAAGSQRVISLAGIAVGQQSPVVHVASRGGSVSATLQTTVVRGLTPSGLSIVTPLGEPALRHVIAALPIIASQSVLEQFTADGGTDGLPTLRLLAPDNADAVVSVTLIPVAGGTGLSTELQLDAGIVRDLPFTGLVDGEYSVVVNSDVPIVVAGRTAAAAAGPGSPGGLDIEWFTPSPVLSAGASVVSAIAPLDGLDASLSASVHLVAPDGDAVVTIDGVSVSVPAGQSVVVPSVANVGVRIETTAPVYVSFTYRGEGLLAGSRVLGPPSVGQPLRVFPS